MVLYWYVAGWWVELGAAGQAEVLSPSRLHCSPAEQPQIHADRF